MASIHRTDVENVISAMQTGIVPNPTELDLSKPVEIQTDKQQVKLVGCRECHRPLVVTTFFAPAKALCGPCKGSDEAGTRVATVGQPVPGQTDPSKAVNLADCLINRAFDTVLCPVHPDDPDHVMELKTITHSATHGPGHYEAKKGDIIWVQDAPGESVQHQCTRCLATVSYSTQRRSPIHRQNAPTTTPDNGIPEKNHWHGLDALPPELAAKVCRYLSQAEVHALLETASTQHEKEVA